MSSAVKPERLPELTETFPFPEMENFGAKEPETLAEPEALPVTFPPSPPEKAWAAVLTSMPLKLRVWLYLNVCVFSVPFPLTVPPLKENETPFAVRVFPERL